MKVLPTGLPTEVKYRLTTEAGAGDATPSLACNGGIFGTYRLMNLRILRAYVSTQTSFHLLLGTRDPGRRVFIRTHAQASLSV